MRSRVIPGLNGLGMHVLEAGDNQAPCVLLVHGYPDLAFGWRKVLPLLAQAGFHAVAPDLRGYGGTANGMTDYTDDLEPYRLTNRLLDMLSLVAALGRRQVALVGHDYGSQVAGFCALARPDVFTSLTLMSAPFGGAPSLEELARSLPVESEDPVHRALASLTHPRIHYQLYNASTQAARDMDGDAVTVGRFLHGYFYVKSANWPGNAPHALTGWTADALAEMPTYYVMDLGRSMPETIAALTHDDADAECPWLTQADLSVYAEAYARSGFQGTLQGYRDQMDGGAERSLALFAGRRIEVPSQFIAGQQDWGTFQKPGALDRMQNHACSAMEGCHLLDGAGHWVQQEQPAKVGELIASFVDRHRPS